MDEPLSLNERENELVCWQAAEMLVLLRHDHVKAKGRARYLPLLGYAQQRELRSGGR
jgi:hypothetical protein